MNQNITDTISSTTRSSHSSTNTRLMMVVCLCLSVVSTALAVESETTLTHEELNELLEQICTEQDMPGLRAAVLLPDGQLIQGVVGLGDVENEIPLDHEIGMPGGSTGKTFVAALTMLLVEDGTLSLDDLASKWVGNQEWFHGLPNKEAIRVRHLLAHTSGMSDYPRTKRYFMLQIWRALRHGGIHFTREELIDLVTGINPYFPVGEGWSYSDSGYVVLGMVIESATERDYYELLAERILDPLALDQIRPQNQSVLPDITPGYIRGARNLRADGTMKTDPSSEWTGGGLVTNPTMLVSFYRALAEGKVVSPDSFRLMKDSGWQNPESPEWHYGFGLFVIHQPNFIEHGGLWSGYRTNVRHYLNEQVTIAVQTNRDNVDLEGATDRIMRLLYQ